MAHNPFGESLQSFQNTMAGIFGGGTQSGVGGGGVPPPPPPPAPMQHSAIQHHSTPRSTLVAKPVEMPSNSPPFQSRPPPGARGSSSDPLGETGLVQSQAPPGIPFPANHPAKAVQVNAELRELMLKSARQLREAEERELRAKEETAVLKRELAILRGSQPEEAPMPAVDDKLRGAASEADRMRVELEKKGEELHAKDEEIRRLTELCQQIGQEHETAVRDANQLLDTVESDAKTVSEQRLQIQRLRGMLESMNGAPLLEVESKRMEAELSRHKSVIETLELKLAHARESAKGRSEQDEGVLEQLRSNAQLIQDQSKEIGRLSDQVRLLKAEKENLARLSQPEGATSAEKAAMRKMKDQLLENAVVISRLEDELRLSKMSTSPMGPADEQRTRAEMEEEILRLKERNTMLEVEAKAYASSVFSLRDELWQAMVVNRETAFKRKEEVEAQRKSLQKVRQKQGL